MIEFDYLYKGLCGLANAHKASALAGHLGAAVAAGYFFGEDLSDLDDEVYRGVEQELERIIKGEEAFWFNAKKAGITAPELFEPLPQEQENEQLTSTIADALEKNISQTRQSGHNVIFASIAIRALHDHPEFVTPSIVAGIAKLIEGFNGVTAGRGYFGKEKGWLQGEQVTLPADNLPKYNSTLDMTDAVIDQLIQSASVRRQGFGGLWHVINHAAGLIELDRFGYKDLAKKGLAAHHHHLRLFRALPDVEAELGAVKRSAHDPHLPEYWMGPLKRDEARLTHRIKTLYGFQTLSGQMEDTEKQKQAEKALLFLMA
jgi:hypothetical protein